MRGLLILFASLFFFYTFSPTFQDSIKNLDINNLLANIRSELQDVDSEEVKQFYNKINELAADIQLAVDKIPQQDANRVPKAEKPSLLAPEGHIFSVHNTEIGDAQTEVEQKYGKPKRTSMNEYGVLWNTYHENYQNFFMVAYDQQQKVAGLYTNQELISSTIGIKRGSSKQALIAQLGEPLNKIQKGLVFYQLQEDRDFDMFKMDNSYITVYYDKHENNIVSAIQIISLDLENQKSGMYGKSTPQLKEGFEGQLFDLTNASRVVHGLSVLQWDDRVKETAREHSADMAANNYFNHVNLEGQSPFDRMSEDEIAFSYAGENLAYGQFSAIYAHEGLMNSLGHRKNILKAEFELLGVGVAFNTEMQPYFTENFYSK